MSEAASDRAGPSYLLFPVMVTLRQFSFYFYFYGLNVKCSTILQQTLIIQNTIEVGNSLVFACGWPIMEYKNSKTNKKRTDVYRISKSKLINLFKIIFSRLISSKCSKDVNSIISNSTVPITLLWATNGLNELPELRFEFSFILSGKLTTLLKI